MPKTATPRKPETVSRKLAETRNTSKNRSLSSLLGIGDNEKRLATDLGSGLNDVIGRGTIAGLLGLPGDLGGAAENGLRSLLGLPQVVPYGGSEHIGQKLEQAGLVSSVRRPKTELLASLISPAQAATAGYKAPQMARAGVKALDNLASAPTMARMGQRGAIDLGAGFLGNKTPTVDKLARVKDKFIFHSGVADDLESIRYGVEPTNRGEWVSDIALSATEDADALLDSSTPLAWFSDEPTWVASKVARRIGKHPTEVTDQDIAMYGHLAMIPRKGDHADSVIRIGNDGLMNGPYSDVQTLRGDNVKAYETGLYPDDGMGNRLEPFGVERNEYVSPEAVEPMFQLTGDELLDFLRKTGYRNGQPVGLLGKMVAPQDEALRVAQANAAKPVSEGGLGLRPDNTPEERAAAMGFDIDSPLYHGTRSDVSEFVPGDGAHGRGVYMTGIPDRTKQYWGGFGDSSGGNVMPLYTNVQSPGPLQDALRLSPSDIESQDRYVALQQRMIRDGYDSASRDLGGQNWETVVFDPRNIRSRFAAFDPMRRDSSDLLAGLAPFGAVPWLRDEEP